MVLRDFFQKNKISQCRWPNYCSFAQYTLLIKFWGNFSQEPIKIHDYHGRLYFNHCITYCRTLCRTWPRTRCTPWPPQKGRPLCRPPMTQDMILPVRTPLLVLSWWCSHPPCYAWVVWWLSWSWLSWVVWLSFFPSWHPHQRLGDSQCFHCPLRHNHRLYLYNQISCDRF